MHHDQQALFLPVAPTTTNRHFSSLLRHPRPAGISPACCASSVHYTSDLSIHSAKLTTKKIQQERSFCWWVMIPATSTVTHRHGGLNAYDTQPEEFTWPTPNCPLFPDAKVHHIFVTRTNHSTAWRISHFHHISMCFLPIFATMLPSLIGWGVES